ncbi:DUF2851 family protein [Adhaeribacter radiodurans]|uniref:DUF2851 family protein n=1 Tax=Adhaeribacter radiodurans TaxID=2745197 RepID=A0A7L7LB61_9BACT|nr:DUF2851 family protein [Adhaeribacter radiodurans]QMU30061.1 DUF2851 family protein [Adhaeribacter radiodurans]
MNGTPPFKEDFLHYVWQQQYFDKAGLVTSHKEELHVLKPGFYNTNAGPDFTDARLRIGAEEWNGSVEIHVYASDWEKHNHQTDPKYNQVILHVVWEDDKPAQRADGTVIPTIALRGRIPLHLVHTYQQFLENRDEIPCSPFAPQVPGLIKISMQERVRMERLQAKADRVLALLTVTQNNWEETCYAWLLSNFGFKINQTGMLRLAKVLPYTILRKHRHQLIALEALLFGQAGFLQPDAPDDYGRTLFQEFTFLQHKYALPAGLKRADWNFLRLRPANFPTVRLAQFAALLHQQEHLFANLLAADSITAWQGYFQVKSSEYWQTHVLLGQETRHAPKGLGKSSIHLLLINAVAPLLVAYGKYKNEDNYVEKAIALLEQLPPEDNRITRLYTGLNFYHQNAADSQALLQLNQLYCAPRNCLQCSIGNFILKKNQPAR